MASWQPPDQVPQDTAGHLQHRMHVLATKVERKGHVHNILTWHGWPGLLALLVLILGLLSSSALRHWLSTAFVTFAIFGGIIAAPVISLVAWIGVTLPVHAPLHQAAPTLFIGALLWMVMGIVSAHARNEDTTGR